MKRLEIKVKPFVFGGRKVQIKDNIYYVKSKGYDGNDFGEMMKKLDKIYNGEISGGKLILKSW